MSDKTGAARMSRAAASPFAYYGAKASIAARIVELLPAHRHYVEPYAGSLAVLLAKPRADHETVNDLDEDLISFWRVLRERPDQLAAAAALTPHARAEHQRAYHHENTDGELERARKVWVLLSQGRGGTLRRTGWRFYRDPAGTSSAMPDYLAAYVDRMPAARRLHGVSLECRPAVDVIADYGQVGDALLYVDPPHPAVTGRARNYRHEMTSPAEHRALADALHGCAAAVVISGYPCDLYDAELYPHWDRVEIPALTGQGGHHGRRTEVIWANRPISHPHLFSEAPIP